MDNVINVTREQLLRLQADIHSFTPTEQKDILSWEKNYVEGSNKSENEDNLIYTFARHDVFSLDIAELFHNLSQHPNKTKQKHIFNEFNKKYGIRRAF